MAVPTTPGEHPPAKEGLLDHLRLLAASVAAYVSARLQLAGIEAREASWHYLKIALLLGAALIGLGFGYIFLCLAAVFILHHLLNVDWAWILLGAALLHFILAAAAILVAKAKFPKEMFAATIAEFKKDQSWLNTPGPTTRRN